MNKTCNVCGQTKPLSKFGMRNEKRADGTPYIYYRPNCKVCRNKRENELRSTTESREKRSKKRKEYYYKNIEKIKAYRQAPENKERQRKYQQEYRKRHGKKDSTPRMTVLERLEKEAKEGRACCSKCKEFISLENFRYWNSKKYQCRVRSYYCTSCENQRFKVVRQGDKYKNRMSEYQKIYRHGSKYRDYRKQYRSDPLVRFRESISAQVRAHIKAVTRNEKKSGKLFDHLPYTPEELVKHVEFLFEQGMSWENYGEWQLDHICPQAALPYDSLAHPNFQKCWDLQNLQPLWASDNARKNSYYGGKKHFYKKDKK